MKPKQLLKLSISKKILALLSVFALLIALLPLYRLAIYAFPRYDDYNYGFWTYSFLFEERSVSSALKGILYSIHVNWYAWQGTFSSIFFMSLMPDAIRFDTYYLGLWAILTMLVISCMVFSATLSKYYLKAFLADRIILGSLVTFALVEQIHTAQQGLFWYNSAVHYTFMHSLLFLLLSLVICLLHARHQASRILLTLFASVLSLACSGANFVTCLQGILLLTGLCFLYLFLKNKNAFYLLPPILIYGFGLYKNISAPGNARRAAYYTGMSPLSAIGHSFAAALKYVPVFCGILTLILMFTAIPVLWNLVKKTDFRFPMPLLILLLSFCFYATGFTPSYYSMGNEGLARTLVVVKFDLQILLFLNEAYLLGWLAHTGKLQKTAEKLMPTKHFIAYYGVCVCMMLLFFLFTKDRLAYFSSWGAFDYVHSGQAYNLHGEYLKRVEKIRSSGDEVAVDPYHFLPRYLINNDLSTSADNEENRMMASWYGKSAIYVEYPKEE